MTKVDKSQYSKAEWQIIREQRRKDKKTSPDPVPLKEVETGAKQNYIVCVKHGQKYSYEYVNRLYRMVKRNCTIPYKFVCLTEDPDGLYDEIETHSLPKHLTGWWCKPYVFSPDLPFNGTILYLDLDVVIADNIDKLFGYSPNQWCVIRDFTRAMRPKWHKYNSSVVRFESGQLAHVWQEFEKNPKEIQRRFHGDQDWLFEASRKKQAMFWPDSWILSWKWEVRKSKQFAHGGRRGNRRFQDIENVQPRPECCIAVFHGDPNPDNCEDPWVKQNWK